MEEKALGVIPESGLGLAHVAVAAAAAAPPSWPHSKPEGALVEKGVIQRLFKKQHFLN